MDEQSDSDVRRAFAAVGATMTGYRSFAPSGPAGGPAAEPEIPPSPFPLLAASLPGTEWVGAGPPAPAAEAMGAEAKGAEAKGAGGETGPGRDGLAGMFRALHGARASGENGGAGLGELFRRL